MFVLKSESLTIQIVKKFNVAVFTWRGQTPSDVFKEGTIQSLETLRKYPQINRIILNTKDHQLVLQEDVTSSVNSTVDYLGVARSNYRMAVIPPDDHLAKNPINWYIDSLNEALKKRFVVRKYKTVKHAFFGLIKPEICFRLYNAFTGSLKKRLSF